MLSVESQRNIERLLTDKGFITMDQLRDYKLRSIQDGKSLLEVAHDAGKLSEEEMVSVLAEASGVQYVNLAKGVTVDPKILNKLPKDTASSYMAVPFGRIEGRLAVAMVDPSNIQAVDYLARKIGEPIVTFMASQAGVETMMLQYAAQMTDDLKAAVKEAQDEDIKLGGGPAAADAKKLQNLVQDAPITRALNTILEYAINSHASDIHMEPREKDMHVRFRIDGVLQDTMTLPKSIEPALISRVKILSNLKIDEHRVPQDGSFVTKVGSKEVDLRISISPVIWGEQVVIRILDKDNSLLTLEALGYKGRAFRTIKAGIHQPHGMTLATGPTGSGKSTTLYASLMAIKDVSINIVTLEDPVEYKMDGVNQIEVNSEVGLTFASGLRSILRQDPNVVMVGEIRDHETAGLAVQAALTGHVVLSTIHTNSAAGVLPRLLDMGVEPFLVASTVNTVIGQRLVRRICKECKEEYQSSAAETESIKKTIGHILPNSDADLAKLQEDLGYEVLPLATSESFKLYRGKGCDKCKDGYQGRMGIYEVFGMTPNMEQLLSGRATTSQIQEAAEKDGMVTMKQDGYLKSLNGITTLEEIARVASDF